MSSELEGDGPGVPVSNVFCVLGKPLPPPSRKKAIMHISEELVCELLRKALPFPADIEIRALRIQPFRSVVEVLLRGDALPDACECPEGNTPLLVSPCFQSTGEKDEMSFVNWGAGFITPASDPRAIQFRCNDYYRESP
jgi:hypothetical protein